MSYDIALVQPPNPVLSDPTTRWPLGLAYLEAALVSEGYKVRAVDLRDKGEDVSLIPPVAIVGFTATTGEIDSTKRMARAVKERDPKTVTWIGGPHATYCPVDCVGSFDLVLRGEAEGCISWLVAKKALDASHYLNVSGVQELDSIAFPVRHLFSFSEMLFEGAGYGKGHKATSILTSRGCPFTCAFCQTKARPVRFRSPEGIVEEIRQIQKDFDCHHFRFEDDNFTLKVSRLLELCRSLEPLSIKFRCHTRSELFNRDIALALKIAGCTEVGFGVESTDQKVLDMVNKKESVEEHIAAIRTAEENGLKAKAFFMAGLPSETDGIMDMTREFLEKARPSKVILSRFTPYPGSDVWANPEKYGVTWIDKDFSHFWNFPSATTVAYIDSPPEVLNKRYKALHNLLWSGEWRKNGH